MSDQAAIAPVVAGADAVVSASGPSTDRKAIGLPLVAGTGHILTAMKRHSVRRYIGHATPAVLDPREKPTPVTRPIGLMPRTCMRHPCDEILVASPFTCPPPTPNASSTPARRRQPRNRVAMATAGSGLRAGCFRLRGAADRGQGTGSRHTSPVPVRRHPARSRVNRADSLRAVGAPASLPAWPEPTKTCKGGA
ncbi:NAD(P)H-binding protein [Streptomyces sp. NPDC054958]